MRLTERQIRSIIRKELLADSREKRLDEFKGIKAALGMIFKGLGAVIGAAFGKASSTYDPSKYTTAYEPSKPGKSPDSLTPKTDPYDQVYALGRVIWHVDTAISLGKQSLGFGLDKLRGLEFPVEPDDENFSEKLQAGTDNLAEALGYFKGYLSKAKSSKVSDIGANIEAGETLVEIIGNFAEAVSAVEALNVMGDWDNITKSEAVQNVIKKDDDSSEKMKNLINSVKGDNMQNIPALSDMKTMLDEANKIAQDAQAVMDFSAEEEGVKPEDSALLDHHKRMIRAVIREVLDGF